MSTQLIMYREYANVVTPIGRARFPHITEKDTEGQYATNKFTTEIVLDEEGTADLKHQYREAAKRMCPELEHPHLPIKTAKDGTVSFIFKSTKKPLIMDAKGKRLPHSTKIVIGGGSTIRVAGVLTTWEKGLTAYLDAVQVIKLAQRDASFEPANVDDGFEYSPDMDGDAPEEGAGGEAPESDPFDL